MMCPIIIIIIHGVIKVQIILTNYLQSIWRFLLFSIFEYKAINQKSYFFLFSLN